MSPSSRLVLCTLLSLSPAVPITARLARLQIVQRSALTSKAAEETQRVSLEIVPRGRILDRSGRPLAESLPSWSSFLDPRAVRKPARVAAELGAAFGIPASEIRRKLRASSRFVWLKRRMNPAQAQALGRLKLEGVGLVADQERFYPNGNLARNVLGLVGSEGKGLSGLEVQFDSTLSGKPVKVRVTRDGAGKGVLLQASAAAQAPPDLRLSLDRNIQHYAETALQEGVARYHPQKGLVLMQDPRTGDLLALASYPSDPLKAHFIQDVYEPGSTYKLVAFAGYLEEKLERPEESFDGEGGRWELAPRVFIKDHEPSGSMTLSEVLERSSNIGSAQVGLRLGPEKFYNYSRMLGFGSRTSLAYPGESAGMLKRPRELTRVSLANNAFGQGVGVTALQLLASYSAVANGGALMEPRLVHSVGAKAAPAPSKVRQAVSPETARRLTTMLEGAVERGTGMPARVPGYWVAGKTGTAQKIDPATRRYSPTQYIASFIGFAPSRDPRLTVLVLMDSPKNQYYGSDVAAPVFAKLMRELLALEGVPPDRPILAQNARP